MEIYGKIMKFIFARKRSNEKNCEKDIGVANDG